MNRCMRILFMIGLLISSCLPAIAAPGQDYRTSLNIPASKIYEGMIKFSNDKQYDSAGSMSSAIKPVLAKIKERFNVDLERDLEAALATRNSDRISRTILKMVYFDIKDVSALMLDENNDKATTDKWFNTLLTDYSILSPYVASANKASNFKIVKLYKDIFVELGKQKKDMQTISAFLKIIDDEFLFIFPEFAK